MIKKLTKDYIKQILKTLEENGAVTISRLYDELKKKGFNINRHYLTGMLLVLEYFGLVELIRTKRGKRDALISGAMITEKGKNFLKDEP